MRIAFVKLGSFSHINKHLINQLERLFPEQAIDVFDVKDLVRHKYALLGLNLWPLVREYGLDMLLRKKRWRDAMLITSWMFDQLNVQLRRVIDPQKYAFSLQTQSMFDAAIPGLTHFVYTDHTVLANRKYPVFDQRQVMYSTPWLKREQLIYQHAHHVFTASLFAKNSIVEDYNCSADKVTCVFTGVNIAVPTQPLAKTYAESEILFVGVEWERKGGPELLAAFKQVLQAHPEARLTVIGCSPTVDMPQVKVLGRVPPETLPPYFERATVFCLPAWIEPAGIAYSEAAWYQLPVVSTPIGGIPDRVVDGETGFLVPPGDIDALAQRLLDLLTNPELCRSMGQAGRERALRLFSWDRVGDHMYTLMQPYLHTLG